MQLLFDVFKTSIHSSASGCMSKQLGNNYFLNLSIDMFTGAQIEKTTNREACRDLSGRRLRDINEEKRYIYFFINGF